MLVYCSDSMDLHRGTASPGKHTQESHAEPELRLKRQVSSCLFFLVRSYPGPFLLCVTRRCCMRSARWQENASRLRLSLTAGPTQHNGPFSTSLPENAHRRCPPPCARSPLPRRLRHGPALPQLPGSSLGGRGPCGGGRCAQPRPSQ